MLDVALVFFQDALNNYIKVKTNGQRENVVRFAEVQLPKDLSMQSNAITMLLVNLEEERLFRSGAAQMNRKNSLSEAGNLCLNFHLLLIANFKDYVDSLNVLSLVLKFFRSYRTFTQQEMPALGPDIQQLSTEMVNLTFMEQGELWRSLDMPCSPSVLYKVKLLVFPDEALEQMSPAVEITTIQPQIAAQ
jgi:hypothetical protein